MLRKYLLLYILFAFVLCLPQDSSAEATAPSYTIGSGDVLLIEVWAGERKEEELSGNYLVFAGEYITMPLLGKIGTENFNLEQLSSKLSTELSRKYIRNPHISIKVEEYGSQIIHVLGAVERPGSFTLERDCTVAEALAKAQGTNRNEKGAKQVKITRESGEKIVVDLEEVLNDGKGNIQLLSGDVIYVTEGLFVIVNGKVESPGTIPWRGGMTITEAIAEAGGALREANLREVYLLRKEERIPVNVKMILQGKEIDIPLEQGDKVFLEESVW